MKMNKVRNLICGFGTNQDPESISVFLRSARANHSVESTEIALITNSTDGLEDILAETNAKAWKTLNQYSPSRRSTTTKIWARTLHHAFHAINRMGLWDKSPEIVASYDAMIESWHHPHFARWFSYKRLLEFHGPYDKIILSDVRDVVFQGPAFKGIQRSVYLYQNDYDFAGSHTDRRWYLEAYGKRSATEIEGKTPICVGVIVGGGNEIQDLVSRVCTRFRKDLYGRVEQAVFNKMLIHEELGPNLKIKPNFCEHIATTSGPATQEETELDGGNIVSRRDGSVFPIVHMYDRHAEYKEAIKNNYT